MDSIKATKRIHTMYKSYRGDMKNIWEEYTFLNSSIYGIKKEGFEIKSLVTNTKSNKTVKDAGGMRTRFLQGGNTKNHYIDAICTFENYICKLASFIYHDFPAKTQGGGMDATKLYTLILNSDSKEDMVDAMIEEKIRSIFYGNPVDVFIKDKCKFELGSIFKEDYSKTMEYYSDIVGRRNVLIHNGGKVDLKYLRENPDSKLTEGKKIIISEDYLRGTIGILLGIAAITTKCSIENIYNGSIQGKLDSAVKSFDKCMGNGWFEDLLL